MSDGHDVFLHVPHSLAVEMHFSADLLQEGFEVFAGLGHDLASPRSESSPILREMGELVERKPDWPEGLLDAVALMAATYVSAIGQHLLALVDLLRSGRMILSPWAIVRSQLEAAGRIGWLLEPTNKSDTPVSPEARVARAHMDALAGLCRRRYSVSKARLGNAVQNDARRERDELVRKTKELFPGAVVEWAKPGDEEHWIVGGEPCLGLGAAIDVFNRIVMPANRGSYDLLSDLSHPTPSLLRSLTQGRPVDDHITYDWLVDPELVRWLVRSAALYHYGACRLLVGYHELNSDPLEEWADRIDEAMGILPD